MSTYLGKTNEQIFEDARESLERRNAELQQQAEVEQAERDRLNAAARTRIDADIESRRIAERDRRAGEDEARRAADERQLRGVMHAHFFLNNPAASEADFDRLFPAMRDEHFRRQMAKAEGAMRAGIANVI